MRLDGVLEAFFQSRMRPIKLHVKKPLCLPSFQFGTADVAEVKTAPANCRVAELFLFTDVFASSFLSRFIDQQEAMRHWLLFVSGESSGMRATHALVRKIACPGRDGPELKEWLHDAFTALQTARYSPNGEEERLHEMGVDHGSMTVGDCVVVGEKIFMVGLDEFYVLSMTDSDQKIMRLDDFIEHNAFEKETATEDQSSEPGTSTSSGSSQEIEADSRWHEEAVESEYGTDETEQRHWALYCAPDEHGWSRPKDRRAMRKQLAEERKVFNKRRSSRR